MKCGELKIKLNNGKSKEMENDDRTQRVQNLIDKMNTPTDETGLANVENSKTIWPQGI